ncbi:MAG: hypothetical protein NTZ83_03800, partial [Candidatus Pacearchaeota archaeon]|nr:hypothetical protein [Candidatus Pacearchaeota archaeon]
AFGICYRGRNSQYLRMEDSSQNLRKITPIIHKLSSQEDDLNDLKFLSNLDSKLKRFLGSGSIGKYNLETGLITIPLPLDQSNQTEESKSELPNLLYAFAGITKQFYETVTSKIKEKKIMDNIGAYMILWSLKDKKDPLEIIFNYHLEEAPNELLRILKGEDLENFIAGYDLVNTG